MIDHSILQPTHTFEDLLKLCEVAMKNDVASDCVNPMQLKRLSNNSERHKWQMRQLKH
jgi:deoxyribose-phosphate aldolase